VYQFRNEARTLAHLQHPHIVRVLEFGVDGDIPFLIMDYAPNGTLRQRHPQGAILSLVTIVKYVKQIADALHYAHNQSLVHRDIKPENMLLGRQYEVLLSDFGIATVAQQSSQAQHTQSVVGTASYMAPEQIQGKPRSASDQYALGVIVYEWLSGERPFHGSFVEITTQHMYASPPSLRQKVGGLSSAVEKVVMTALEKDPHQRFPSVSDFGNALEQSLLSPASSINVPLPPKPQQSLSGTPPPPAIPTATVPALPRPSVSRISWPTFSISLDERRAISSGKLSQEPLITTGQVLLTPPGPLPVVMVPSPPVTFQVPLLQQGAARPTINISPTLAISPIQAIEKPSSGGIIRSTEPISMVQVGAGQPVATSSSNMTIIRSSGSSSTSLTTPSSTILAQAKRLSVTSLIIACLSVIPLITAFAVAAIPRIVDWEPWTIFTIVILAFLLGVAAIRKNRVVNNPNKLAGWGISLSVLVALAECARLLLNYFR
jgi:serine/threonine protein kinase